jgi:hypothetical protein
LLCCTHDGSCAIILNSAGGQLLRESEAPTPVYVVTVIDDMMTPTASCQVDMLVSAFSALCTCAQLLHPACNLS